MRCLNCHLDGIAAETQLCPNCKADLTRLTYDVLPQGTLLEGGKYRIDYALGRGGFGITYRAEDLYLDRWVAIKEFYPQNIAERSIIQGTVSVPTTSMDTYERWLKRFEREGQILAKLNHPGIVRVLTLFKERDTAYLVMELLSGKSLEEELSAHPNRCLPPERVTQIMEAMVQALDTVHSKEVYHLDLKPDNVMLTDDGRIVLIDFGSARYDVNKSTRAMTPKYAPLELLSGESVGPQSDLFELGMIIHELLTGHCPPPALSRISQERWEPTDLGEPWHGMLVDALQLTRLNRPQSVLAWWRSHRQTASPQTNPPPAPHRPPVVERSESSNAAGYRSDLVPKTQFEPSKLVATAPAKKRNPKWLLFGLVGLCTLIAAVLIGYFVTRNSTPEGYLAYYDRAKTEYDAKNYQKAIDDYNQAIRHNPEHAESYNWRGNAKRMLEDFSGAVSDYSLAIQKKSDYSEAYYNRGNAKLRLGDTPGAIQDFQNTLRLSKDQNNLDLVNQACRRLSEYKAIDKQACNLS
jgi:serine/threonine protein kinase